MKEILFNLGNLNTEHEILIYYCSMLLSILSYGTGSILKLFSSPLLKVMV